MVVTAMLPWFDEPPAELAACVRRMAAVADRVLAVDGAYRDTPGARPSSPPEQADAIREAAEEVGLAHAVVTPEFVWDGQVQKRDFLFRAACEGSDWVIPVDADWRLYGDRDAVRRELQQEVSPATPAVLVDWFVPPPPAPAGLVPSVWHASVAGKLHRYPLLFRCGLEPRVEHRHWWYSAVFGGRRQWLWDGDGRYPVAQLHRLRAPFLIEHRCFFREVALLERNRDYRLARDAECAVMGFER
jgi:hypothetical protein